MDLQNSLNNQLLIAMPGLADPNFSTTVTLICEHNDEGALGIVINRPSNLDLAGLFERRNEEWILDQPELSGLFSAVGTGGGRRPGGAPEGQMFVFV